MDLTAPNSEGGVLNLGFLSCNLNYFIFCRLLYDFDILIMRHYQFFRGLPAENGTKQ